MRYLQIIKNKKTRCKKAKRGVITTKECQKKRGNNANKVYNKEPNINDGGMSP